ncbi:unnamed protein product [Dimorphilus gyrociliatus]|nr:unnamed protein product [Dimorphilus gyrociliatus]
MVKSSSTRSLDSGYDSYSSLPKNSSATLRELLQGEQIGAKSLPCNLDSLATAKADDKNSLRRQSLEGGGFGVKFFLENDDDEEPEERGTLCKVCSGHKVDKEFCVECSEFFNETIKNRVRYTCTCPQKCSACKLKKCFEAGLRFCEPISIETGYLGTLLKIEPPDRRADNVNDDLTEVFIKLYNKVLLDNINWAKLIPKFDKLSQEDQICFLESSWMELLSWECIWRSRVHAGEYVQFATDLIFDRRKCEDGGVGGNLTPYLFDLSEKAFDLDISKEEYVLLKVIILVNGRIKQLPHCTINDDVFSALDEYSKRKFGDGSAKRISNLLSLLPHVRQLSQNAISRLYEAKNDSNLPICDLLKDILSEKSCK